MRPFSVNVFCGARGRYKDIGYDVGQALAKASVRTIYGGSRFGVMGAVADGVISVAREPNPPAQAIVGWMPRYLKDNYAHRDILVYETDSLSDRKRRMMDESDAFLCLPGGVGSMDELFSAWGEAKLGEHAKPIAILNMFGFYDGLVAQLNRMVLDGFLSVERLDFVRLLTSVEDVADWIREIQVRPTPAAELDSDG